MRNIIKKGRSKIERPFAFLTKGDNIWKYVQDLQRSYFYVAK